MLDCDAFSADNLITATGYFLHSNCCSWYHTSIGMLLVRVCDCFRDALWLSTSHPEELKAMCCYSRCWCVRLCAVVMAWDFRQNFMTLMMASGLLHGEVLCSSEEHWVVRSCACLLYLCMQILWHTCIGFTLFFMLWYFIFAQCLH